MDADAKNRTAAAIPIHAVIVDHAAVQVYLLIANKAKHLWELGMSDRASLPVTCRNRAAEGRVQGVTVSANRAEAPFSIRPPSPPSASVAFAVTR